MAFFSPRGEPCEPEAICLPLFGYQLLLDYQNSMYLGVGLVLLALLLYSFWPRPPPPPLPPAQTELEAVERTIEKGCADVSGVTTGIFIFSLFLSVLRPDPTPAVTLFGFYGTHVRSKGSIRSFWVFLSVTVCVDVLWLVEYSPLQPIGWEQLQLLSRKEQIAIILSAVNAVYKLLVIHSSIWLCQAFAKREALLNAATSGVVGTTSSGDPLDSRSLSAQVAINK
ncbi:hypothetical protein AB1Y20_023422 [Prymnesium parvum]|uniref:Uncharacterized protein n=1 Tax=Prymnesium parvum TaxID=97485 RepID=A0AB34JDY0_PRYPA